MSQKKNKQKKEHTKNEVRYQSALEKWSRKSLNVLIYLSLILPFLAFSPWHVSSFEMVKNVVFMVLGLLMLFFFLIYLFESPKKQLNNRQKFFLKIIAVFWGFRLFSFIFSLSKFISFWGSFIRQEGLLTQAFLTLFCLVLIFTVDSKKQVHKYLWTIVSVATVVAFYGVLQKFGIDFKALVWDEGAYQRIASTLGNPLFLGSYLVFSSAMAIYLFVISARCWPRIILGVSLLIMMLAIYFTFTSSSLLGILTGLFFGAGLFFWKKNNKAIFVLLLIFVISILVGSLSLTGKINVQHAVLDDFSMRSVSNLQRLYVWDTGLKSFWQKPFWGWGNDLFDFAFIVNKNINLMSPFEDHFDRAHNFVIDKMVMEGLFVLVAFLFLFGYALRVAIKKYFQNRDSLYLLMASILIMYFVIFFFSIPTISSYLIWFFVLAIIFYEEKKQENISYRQSRTIEFKARYFVMIIILVFSLTQVVRPWRADSLYKKSTYNNIASEKIALLSETTKIWPSLAYKVELYKLEKNILEKLTDKNNDLKKELSEKMSLLVQEMQENHSTDYTSYMVLLDYYAFVNDKENFEKTVEEFTKKYPRYHFGYWYVAALYESFHDYDKTQEFLWRAIALDDEQPRPYLELSKFYKKSGQQDLEKENFEKYEKRYQEKYENLLGF